MTKQEIADWALAVMSALLEDPGGPRSAAFRFYDLWRCELNAAWHDYRLTR